MTIRFRNVAACSYRPNSGVMTFGRLAGLGLLTKEYVTEPWDHDGDNSTIVWTVVGDVEFTTEDGQTFRKGDVIRWEK